MEEAAVDHMIGLAVVDVADPCGHQERRVHVRADTQEVEPHRCLPEPAVHPAAFPAAAL